MFIKSSIFGFIALAISTAFLAQPSFNGTAPGCDGSGCHSLQAGSVSASPQSNLQVEVTVSGVQSGSAVAGELVDAGNNVVDVVNQTNSNPFTLTAPQPGTYTVNAGYRRPSREYGTTTVEFTATSINIPTPNNNLSTFQLYQNHPNPFNSETIIRFSLPKGARVELTVFDINGKLISELANGFFQSGIHAVKWNGRDSDGKPVSSGIYLCQIKSGENRIAKAMILSK